MGNILKALNITLADLEKCTMIDGGTRRKSHRILPEDKMFITSHQTVMEFQAARYIWKQMPLQQFKKVTEEKLFSVEHFDQYHLIRRFICGLIASGGEDFEDKQTFFIKNLCDNINQAMMEFNNPIKSRDHIWLTARLKTSLLLDVTELRKILDTLKPYLLTNKMSFFGVVPCDCSEMEGVMIFIENMKPNINQLRIVLPPTTSPDVLSRFSEAVSKHGHQVEFLQIVDLPPVETRAGVVRNLLGNVSIHIIFNLDLSTTQEYFLKFKEKVVNNQTQMKLNTHVCICHRKFYHLIRPQFTMTSNEWNEISEHPQHLVKTLHEHDEMYNTIDLRLRHDDQMLKDFRSCKSFRWFIFITQKQETDNLSRLIKVSEPAIIELKYFLQESYTKNDVLQFSKALCNSKNRVGYVHLFNITSVCNIIPEIKMIASKSVVLYIYAIKDHTEKEMNEVVETLKVTAKKHDVQIQIYWVNEEISNIGNFPNF